MIYAAGATAEWNNGRGLVVAHGRQREGVAGQRGKMVRCCGLSHAQNGCGTAKSCSRLRPYNAHHEILCRGSNNNKTHIHTQRSATNNVGFCVWGIFDILPVYVESMIGILTRCLPIGSARACRFIIFSKFL